MFSSLFGSEPDERPADTGSDVPLGVNKPASESAPPRPSGAFAGVQKLPTYTLIVVLPANHSVSLDRVAARMPRHAESELEVIIACAGQPSHTTVTAIHAHLRTAQFLLAPAQTGAADLRALAFLRATGDIITLVDGVSDKSLGAERVPVRTRQADSNGVPLSVIVPARNGGPLLDEALAAIVASDAGRDTYELIVVDDASSDGSPATAARYADIIVRLKAESRGAAYARNRGAEQARGDVLAFVDADVRVKTTTITKLLGTFAGDPLVCAVGASCDGTSGDGGVPTQYWNLLQQFGAHTYGGLGIHFEAACGAVRRKAFIKAGMFNEWLFRGASVEDLDLGTRLHRTGHQVLLRPDVAVTHLRPHSLYGVLGAVWRRSTMVTRTLGYGATRQLARTDIVHTLNGSLGFVAAGVATMGVLTVFDPRPPMIVGSAAATAVLLAANSNAYRFFARRRGLTFAIAAAPLHVAAQIVATAGRCGGWVLRNVVGDPTPDATTQAFAEVGVQIWPPVPRKL